MKSLLWLHDMVLAEAGTRCGTDTHRDRITLARRTEDEGDSFLTITLPRFCQDFERCLERGMVSSPDFLGFRRSGGLPRFLSGFLRRIFDPIGGRLLDQPCHESILCIRQFCLMSKKVLLPCTPKRERAALDTYGQVEKELTEHFSNLSEFQFEEFGRVADVMWSTVWAELVDSISSFDLTPRHGPGATAEKIRGNTKYQLKKWHTRLEPFFPLDWYGLPKPDLLELEGDLDEIELVDPDAEQPVRVVSVPKTLRTPRIIAIEPVCMQYTQQALARAIVRTLEQHPLTRGHINFTDQRVNRKLALDSSKSQNFATVDLSEASDRVGADLVYRMLASVPTFRDAVFACRSIRATLEDGRTYHLTKFASMGSALCFPVEAMVFYTLCVMARLQALSLHPTPRNIKSVSRSVYVYGDDIIVPANEVHILANLMALYGLKVNSNKSFGTGKFRESCGMDAYDGTDVTPCYVRRLFPRKKQDFSEIVSTVSLANQLYHKGWWATARHVRAKLEALTGPLPHVRDTSPCLGWTSVDNRYTVHGWDSDLHCHKVRGMVVSARSYADPLLGYAALMKCFLGAKLREEESVGDTLFDALFPRAVSEDHLERSVRSGSVRINCRWVPAT